MKRRHSRKVRVFGYGIVVFELLAVAVWVISVIGNAMVIASIGRDTLGKGGGGIGFSNSTSGETLTIPVEGGGLFQSTVSTSAEVLDSRNVTVLQLHSSVTLSPGQTQNLAVTVPSSTISSLMKSGYYIRVSFEVSSLNGLSGTGVTVVVKSCALNGGRCS